MILTGWALSARQASPERSHHTDKGHRGRHTRSNPRRDERRPRGLGAVPSYRVTLTPSTSAPGRRESDRKPRGKSEEKTYLTQHFSASPAHLPVWGHKSQGQRGAEGQVPGPTSSPGGSRPPTLALFLTPPPSPRPCLLPPPLRLLDDRCGGRHAPHTQGTRSTQGGSPAGASEEAPPPGCSASGGPGGPLPSSTLHRSRSPARCFWGEPTVPGEAELSAGGRPRQLAETQFSSPRLRAVQNGF